MNNEGYYSRHYVNWMRHLLYRDALKLRLHRARRKPSAEPGGCLISIETTSALEVGRKIKGPAR